MKGFPLQILVPLDHNLLELVKIVDQQDLLDNLPLLLVALCLLTSLKELLLVDANVGEQRLHEGVNESSELLVNHLLLFFQFLGL